MQSPPEEAIGTVLVYIVQGVPHKYCRLALCHCVQNLWAAGYCCIQFSLPAQGPLFLEIRCVTDKEAGIKQFFPGRILYPDRLKLFQAVEPEVKS